MATTRKGIYYPTDYSKVADVPADLKNLAESVDKAIDDIPEYDDADVKGDIRNLKENDEQQDEDIETLQTKQTELEAEIQELEKDIQSNAIIEETEQAKSLHIDDASGARGSLNIEGNAEQSESASPSNPAEIKCLKDSTEIKHINKNFLNLSELTVANNNGIDTYSIDNVNQITLKNKLTNTGNTYTYAFQAFKLNLPNGNYNFQAKTQTNSPNYRIVIRGKKNNENVTAVEVVSQSKDNSNFTVDYSQCDEYIVEFYANQSFNTEIATTTYYDIQIEKNSKTDFEEHKEETFNLDIQQEMLLGDYFIKEVDGWKEVHIFGKYSFTGQEIYQKSDSYSDDNWFCGFTAGAGVISSTVIKQDGKMYATRFSEIGSYAQITDDNCIRCSSQMHVRISTEYLTENTAEAYQNLLTQWNTAGEPLIVYYELQTPTKLACTEAQIEVLEKLNKLRFYKGVNNIFTTEDIALLQAKYPVDIQTKINNVISTQLNQIGGNQNV